MYQQAINSVSGSLLKYCKNQTVPVYGFGAFPRFPGFNSGVVSHFFPCSGSWENCAGIGVSGVNSLYNHALVNVSFYGPTYFSPMINEIIKYTMNVSPYNLLNPNQCKRIENMV